MASSRYPRRNRNTVLRPDSAQGSGQAASSSKDQEEESGSEQVQHRLLLQLFHDQRLRLFLEMQEQPVAPMVMCHLMHQMLCGLTVACLTLLQ